MIPKPFLKFQKVKKQTKKDPFKIQNSKIIFKLKKSQKTDQLMWPIQFQNYFFHISKSQKQTKKDPFKIQ